MLKFNYILENVEGTTTSHLWSHCAIITRPAKPGIDFKPSALEEAEKMLQRPVCLHDFQIVKVIYEDGTWRDLGTKVIVDNDFAHVSIHGKKTVFHFRNTEPEDIDI